MKKTYAFLSALAFTTAGYAAAPAEAPGLKFTGFLQYRYEWIKNPEALAEDTMTIDTNGDHTPDTGYVSDPSTEGNAGIDGKSQTETLLWLNIDNQFDGHTRFHGAAVARSLGGRTTRTNLAIYEAYVAAKFGPAEVAVGRFLSDTGLGMIAGAPFMDGIHVSVGNELVKGQAYVTKFGNVHSAQEYPDGLNGHMTFASGDLKIMPIKGLTVSLSYFADVTSDGNANLYKAYKAGAEYRYVSNNIPWFTVMGEYGKNKADGAKNLNTPLNAYYQPIGEAKEPAAFIASAKVLGAHPFMPGTGGFQIQYRNADAGFDAMGMCNPLLVNNPFNWMTPSAGGIMDNCKGIEISGEITLLPRTILKAAYGMMKVKDMSALQCLSTHNVGGSLRTDDTKNYFSAQIFYLF
ncbi:hypothetical protein [Holophaga foetida]|uniref:hypothetical protein n=1 Tax=Holophaga foetida TaxID=35839 RepID=UPI0002473AFD|nr:hypothetical protein [Holophaga foetida]